MGNAVAVDSRTDEELVAAANRGSATAFEALYQRHREWVVRLAYRFTRNEHDALDVLQDTFAYFFGKFPGFHLTARLTTFLYPVVRNLALTRRRKAARLRKKEAADEIRAILESQKKEELYLNWLQEMRATAEIAVDWAQLEQNDKKP